MVTFAVPGSQPSSGLTEHPEQNDVEEERRAKPRRTFDPLQKCFAAAFCTGAAVVGIHIAALVSAESCGHGRGARIEGDHMHFGSIRRYSQGTGCEVRRTGFRHRLRLKFED